MVLLQRGANANLTAQNKGLSAIVVALGWSAPPATEVVVLGVACTDDQRAVSPEHVAFFNQETTLDGSIAYRPDSDKDVEQIDVVLGAIPGLVQSVKFVVASPAGLGTPVLLSALSRPFIRVLAADGSELVRFDLDGIPGEETSMIFGELYRHRDDWKFRAVGQGYVTGLSGVGQDLGLAL